MGFTKKHALQKQAHGLFLIEMVIIFYKNIADLFAEWQHWHDEDNLLAICTHNMNLLFRKLKEKSALLMLKYYFNFKNLLSYPMNISLYSLQENKQELRNKLKQTRDSNAWGGHSC